jgi:hypothetical protein
VKKVALIAAALVIATAGYAAAAGTLRIIRLQSGQSVKIGKVKVIAVGKTRVVTKTVARRPLTVTGPTTTVTMTSTITVPGPSSTVTVPAADTCTSPVAYPGDDAPREAIAQWMAHGARARRVPGELPVMAALVESGLRNLNFGDIDSAGYFGMRRTIWDSGIYAGFPHNPDLQLTWFIDQAVAIRAVRIAAGDLVFGADPSRWGEWVADVVRPAEQFRSSYQPRLGEARALIGASCSDVPVVHA